MLGLFIDLLEAIQLNARVGTKISTLNPGEELISGAVDLEGVARELKKRGWRNKEESDNAD